MKTGKSNTQKFLWGFLSILAAVCFTLVAVFPASAKTALYTGKPAKYILLFIGDGMGIPQRMATQEYAGKKLTMNTFPAQGLTTTYANNRFITGSAASATALATGYKTNTNYLSVDPNQKPLKTIAETAKSRGQKVGIVSSVSIDHATPAAFYAHINNRRLYHEIDMALVKSGFDFFGGGGMKDPAGLKSKNPQGDAISAAMENGYRIVNNRKAFLGLKKGEGRIIAWNKWLQNDKALPYALDMTPEDITLAEFASKAIEILDNPKGFFLMVEGGKIDWACHANDAASVITNNLAFDRAVKVGLDFYNRHKNETLIVVTGDHECGGFSLGFAGTKYASHFDVLHNQKVSFQKFKDDIMMKFKAGKDRTFQNMKPIITENFGLKFEGDVKSDHMILRDHEINEIMEAFKRSMNPGEKKSKDPQLYLLYGDFDPLSITLTHIMGRKAGLGWTSYKHTGVPVNTSAIGKGSEIFNGFYDNTNIAHKILSVMGVKAGQPVARQ